MFNFNKKKLVRLTLINNESLDYQLIKKSKKTLSLKISENGLVVSAPLFMSEKKINQLVISKIKWIKKKLELIEPQKNKLFIKNRASFDLLGKEIKITLLDGNNKIEWVDENNLKIFFKDQDDQKKLKTFFIKWLKEIALDYFSQRAYEISKLYAIPSNSILLSNAKSRWGTCNSKTEVRINWRLIQADPYVIDYVICHEFAHLTHMNHSRNFWNLVEKLCPNYKLAENYLKNKGFNLYLID
ncbi:MAG: M48 family metallopeptidase [Betaproteobacteria bacterium]|jgi:predicted metal-dependent hydrolase|nr:M48 family metallopeptidase [Nitrosomonadales bacterium]MCH9771233.1 M48 family metallopeptidase [Betaproteobacteria bacterium]|tara:strand:- start:1067 stop:1792 length:726 start_codon:yes stop_codon:yes gene_type:complete